MTEKKKISKDDLVQTQSEKSKPLQDSKRVDQLQGLENDDAFEVEKIVRQFSMMHSQQIGSSSLQPELLNKFTP